MSWRKYPRTALRNARKSVLMEAWADLAKALGIEEEKMPRTRIALFSEVDSMLSQCPEDALNAVTPPPSALTKPPATALSEPREGAYAPKKTRKPPAPPPRLGGITAAEANAWLRSLPYPE